MQCVVMFYYENWDWESSISVIIALTKKYFNLHFATYNPFKEPLDYYWYEKISLTFEGAVVR